jgi:hypothetical protein
MSKDRASIVWTVLLTVGVTATVAVGGWFVWSQYFDDARTSASPSETAANAPSAPRRAPRAQKGNSSSSRSADASTAGAQTGAPPAAEGDAPGKPGDNGPAGAGRPGAEPATTSDDAKSGRGGSSEPANLTGAPKTQDLADNNQDARTIVHEAQYRTEAKSHQYDGLLQMFDTKEKVTEKRWSFDRLGSHGQSKVVLRFTAPAEVKGVALLIVNHPDRASDQWMWTPALERDRRIALQDRSTRFFGTDFSFEDLEERDVDQYDYSMLGTDTVDGAACWKIQSTPKKSKSSQYSRAITWIRKDNYATARLENYVGDEVVRRLNCSNIENVQGIWTARQLEMADLRRGSRTRLTLQQIKYNVPTKAEDFTLQAIRRQ